jgi:hypothetical protein
MKKLLFIAIVLVTIIGCNEESPLESESDLFVISAFLYADEPIENIQVTTTLPLESEDTLAPPIINAEVVLIKNGTRYSLVQTLEKPGFYNYPENDLQVLSGDEFRIEVSYNDDLAYGETSVPDKPQNVSISSAFLGIPEITIFDVRSGTINIDDYTLLISWDNNDGTLYYVVVENLEMDPAPIFEDLPAGNPKRFISSPAPTSEYKINLFTVTHFGSHRAIVYKVNQEYADLYESREQDSRNLNEPLTNITNALGVFSAFASDTVYFNIYHQ